MTEKFLINVNNPLTNYEIGVFNRVKAISIPSGVTVEVAFVDSARNEYKYPLSDLVELKISPDVLAEAKNCFIHTVGTSTSDLVLQCSNVSSSNEYVDLKLAETIKQVDRFSGDLLSALDKIVNPHESVLSVGGSNSTSLTTIIDKTLTCDKIRVNFGVYNTSNIYDLNSHGIALFIDGYCVLNFSKFQNNDGAAISSNTIIIEDTKGKNLKIKALTNSPARPLGYTLEEFTLKQ
jgi:hypothetical protein